KPQRADGRHAEALEEEHHGPAADDGSPNAHGQRGESSARIAARHDRLGQQTNDGAESYPNKHVVGRLMDGLSQLRAIHTGTLATNSVVRQAGGQPAASEIKMSLRR